jgi:23S rRNA pseudouridine2605 synthase
MPWKAPNFPMTSKRSRSTEPDPRGERLQKGIARAGVASRRACERLIAAGRVTVNDEVVTEPGTRVLPGLDSVSVDGRPIGVTAPRRYVLLDKPPGYLTTVTDPFGRRTVMDLVPDERPGLFPVGRLDLDTEGLLLLTDDGELGNRLIHPRYHVPKTYEAVVEGAPSAEVLSALEGGVELEDGLTSPAQIGRVEHREDGTLVEITIHEGKKRQVRRMFAAVGHPVSRLARTRFGPLTREGIEPGGTRHLTADEVRSLRHGADLEA